MNLTAEELRFWEAVYIEAFRRGYTDPSQKADYAIIDRRERFTREPLPRTPYR